MEKGVHGDYRARALDRLIIGGTWQESWDIQRWMTAILQSGRWGYIGMCGRKLHTAVTREPQKAFIELRLSTHKGLSGE